MAHKLVAAVALLLAVGAFAAEKSETVVMTFPASADKLVMVDAGPLDIAARVAEIGEIRVTVELVAGALSENQAVSWVEAHRPTFDDGGSVLRIVAPDPPGSNLAKGVIISKARLQLVVPPSVRLDLSTSSGNLRAEGDMSASKVLRLRTASGDLEMIGWAPEVEARSTSGDITLRASKALGSLLARSSSGSIALVGGARTLRCDTSSGNVNLQGLLGAASILTTSGSVTVQFDALQEADTVSVDTLSGRVRITLPPGTTPSGEVSTTSGEIRSAYPGEGDTRGGKLLLAGQGPRLSISSEKGKIELY